MTTEPFAGTAGKSETNGHGRRHGRVGRVTWPLDDDGFINSYCNTIPTAEGGTHEAGFRLRARRAASSRYGEIVRQSSKAAIITTEDVMDGAAAAIAFGVHRASRNS